MNGEALKLALKLALEALEWNMDYLPSRGHGTSMASRAIAAAIEALSAPPQDEERDPCPGCQVGAVCRTPACGRLKLPLDHPYRSTQAGAPVPEPKFWYDEEMGELYSPGDGRPAGCTPLYTTPPPQRGWIGLSETEKTLLWANHGLSEAQMRACEGFLKVKNT
jgi:hypothetical protein